MKRLDQTAAVLRFGTFELDLVTSELRKGGTLVKLQSQHSQLLALLAGRRGQLVSREEIRRSLWDDDTFVDFDRSINFCVNKIREALGDDPQSPRYIETLPRKGYRFIAPVTESGEERAKSVGSRTRSHLEIRPPEVVVAAECSGGGRVPCGDWAGEQPGHIVANWNSVSSPRFIPMKPGATFSLLYTCKRDVTEKPSRNCRKVPRPRTEPYCS